MYLVRWSNFGIKCKSFLDAGEFLCRTHGCVTLQTFYLGSNEQAGKKYLRKHFLYWFLIILFQANKHVEVKWFPTESVRICVDKETHCMLFSLIREKLFVLVGNLWVIILFTMTHRYVDFCFSGCMTSCEEMPWCSGDICDFWSVYVITAH